MELVSFYQCVVYATRTVEEYNNAAMHSRFTVVETRVRDAANAFAVLMEVVGLISIVWSQAPETGGKRFA